MGIFVVQVDKGAFLSKGERVTRLPEQTNFYLFANTKDEARQLSQHYVADRIGNGSGIEQQAIFDPVSVWVRHADSSEHLNIIENTLADAARFIGTIQIESFAIISPAHEVDTLIVSAAEGGKRRSLFREIYFMENGSVEWGEEMSAFNLASLATAIQELF